jgi:hypothetical protein
MPEPASLHNPLFPRALTPNPWLFFFIKAKSSQEISPCADPILRLRPESRPMRKIISFPMNVALSMLPGSRMGVSKPYAF